MARRDSQEKSPQHTKAAHIRHSGAIVGRLKAVGDRVWRLLTP
jgi:hypothetical protein